MTNCAVTVKQTKLFESHKKLAFKIAYKMAKRVRHVDVEDFKQVSLQALWIAAGRFNSTMGKSFASYAIPCCEGECKLYLSSKAEIVRRPAPEFWKNPKTQQVFETSTALDENEQVNSDSLLDRLLASETLTPIDILLENEKQEKFKQFLESLPWEWAFALERYYFHGDRVKVIAEKINQPAQNVAFWISSALRQLRSNLVSHEHNICGLSVDQVAKVLMLNGRVPVSRVSTMLDVSHEVVDVLWPDDSLEQECSPHNKLSDSQHEEILALKGAMSQREAAKRYGVSKTIIGKIWRGMQRKGQARGESHGQAKITDKQVEELLALKGTMPAAKAALVFGVSRKTVANIWSGKTRARPSVLQACQPEIIAAEAL